MSYYDDNTTLITSQDVLDGNTTTAPTTPIKEGYKFTGWYTDKGCTQLFDFNTAISNNLDLYAGWEEIVTYDVTFVDNNSTYVIVNNVISGESVGDSNWPTNPLKAFATFEGWYNGNTKYDASTPIKSNITLNAKYSYDSGLVQFDQFSVYNEIPGDTAVAGSEHRIDDKIIFFGAKTGDKAYTFDSQYNLSKYVQTSKIRLTLEKPMTLNLFVTQTNATNTRNIVVSNSMGEKILSTAAIPLKDNATTKESVSLKLNSGTYTINGNNDDGSSGALNFYGFTFEDASISKNVTATFKAQYNGETPETSTKLRFLGKIEGIADTDISNIASITFKYTFNGDREGKVTHVYQSITGLDGYEQATNTLYAVFTLKNINREAYKGKSLSNLQLVITYADGSSTIAEHSDIELPQFTKTI